MAPEIVEIASHANQRSSNAMFDEGWQKKLGIGYQDLQWVATGERLTPESFARYRKIGGRVIIHMIPEPVVQAAVASPITMIASDGVKGHPRSSGTYALGYWAGMCAKRS